jgi:hypothetical protein
MSLVLAACSKEWNKPLAPASSGARSRRAAGNPKHERGMGGWVSNETEKLGAKLDPEVRSWIKNVIVPAMVCEFMAEHSSPNSLAKPIALVPQCKANGRLSAEGIQ